MKKKTSVVYPMIERIDSHVLFLINYIYHNNNFCLNLVYVIKLMKLNKKTRANCEKRVSNLNSVQVHNS